MPREQKRSHKVHKEAGIPGLEVKFGVQGGRTITMPGYSLLGPISGRKRGSHG